MRTYTVNIETCTGHRTCVCVEATCQSEAEWIATEIVRPNSKVVK